MVINKLIRWNSNHLCFRSIWTNLLRRKTTLKIFAKSSKPQIPITRVSLLSTNSTCACWVWVPRFQEKKSFQCSRNSILTITARLISTNLSIATVVATNLISKINRTSTHTIRSRKLVTSALWISWKRLTKCHNHLLIPSLMRGGRRRKTCHQAFLRLILTPKLCSGKIWQTLIRMRLQEGASLRINNQKLTQSRLR